MNRVHLTQTLFFLSPLGRYVILDSSAKVMLRLDTILVNDPIKKGLVFNSVLLN